jgi:hypothetical protein
MALLVPSGKTKYALYYISFYRKILKKRMWFIFAEANEKSISVLEQNVKKCEKLSGNVRRC